MKPRLARYLKATLLLAALFLFGCKDINVTYENTTPWTVRQICVKVKIMNAPSFPAVSEWYQGKKPASITQDVNGGTGWSFYTLCWDVNIPPGGSVHVGGSFEEDQKIEQTNKGWEGPVGPGAVSGSLSVNPRYTQQNGLVLDALAAAESPTGFTVKKLQWVAYTEPVALGNLDWTDPVLSLFPWRNVAGATPFDLEPGQVRTFDIPDGALAGKTHVLMRWIAVDPEGALSDQAVVQMEVVDLPKAPDAIPAEPTVPVKPH